MTTVNSTFWGLLSFCFQMNLLGLSASMVLLQKHEHVLVWTKVLSNLW